MFSGGPDATELNNTLHKCIDAKRKKIVVDLKGVSSMNSSGLGMLIGGVTTMRNVKGDLKLAGASEKIIKLLQVTKLLSVFEHFDTVKLKSVERKALFLRQRPLDSSLDCLFCVFSCFK